jgi:uncharacterized membrane protein (UPF0127 family)
MTIIIILAIVLIVVDVFYVWHFVFSKAPNPPLTTGEVSIGENVFTVEMATTSIEEARGLSFRKSLADGTGMLFTFDPGVQQFWMKDMNFPIDIIWVASGKVAGFVEKAQPEPGVSLLNLQRYNSPDGVDKVLEVNAGIVVKDSIKVGDTVNFGPNTL